MYFSNRRLALLLVATVVGGAQLSFVGAAQAQDLDLSKIRADTLKKWGQAEIVVTANLSQAVPRGVSLSNPPIYRHLLQLQVQSVLRGSDVKKGNIISGQHSIKQQNQPVFAVGKSCLVSMSKVRGYWRVNAIKEATPVEIEQIRLACAMPLGWSKKGKEFFSPWASLGKKAWPGTGKKGMVHCSATGRPAFLTGDVQFIVKKEPPKKNIRFRNPDGDGEYRVFVRNLSDKAVTVPALLSDGKKILWTESIVILCQDKIYPHPDAKGVTSKNVTGVTLKPNQTVTTVVQALKLQGPRWPRGGYRIEFSFCLGDQSSTHSFYYYSKHHDPIRKQATGG